MTQHIYTPRIQASFDRWAAVRQIAAEFASANCFTFKPNARNRCADCNATRRDHYGTTQRNCMCAQCRHG